MRATVTIEKDILDELLKETKAKSKSLNELNKPNNPTNPSNLTNPITQRTQ